MLLTDACKNTLCTLRIIMLSKTSRFVCPDLFFYKQNTKKTMKMGMKHVWPFHRFRIEGRKQQNSDFQSHFSMSKINRILLNFFFTLEYKKGEQLLLLSYFDNFDF